MKPLPSQSTDTGPASGGAVQSLPSAVITPPPASYSSANRRATSCFSQRIYPMLLCTSTLVAALFCLMYITKPVILAAPSNPSVPAFPEKQMVVVKTSKPDGAQAGLLPSGESLPGEKADPSISHPIPASAVKAQKPSISASAFEETNLRIQHILTAEAPGGSVARIDIEVPVLYQSRNLRWTPNEVAEARALLVRLADYQEKARTLRSEGIELLDSWNHLVEHSIPTGELRADSPTLPINQQDSADAPQPAGLSTTESIQIQPAGK